MANRRILLFLPHLDVSGGLGVHCRLMLDSLLKVQKEGVDFHIATLADPLSLMKTATREPLNREQYRHFKFHSIEAPADYDLADAADPLLKSITASVKPDLIYCSYYTGMHAPPCRQIIAFHDAGFLENPAGFGATAARRFRTIESLRDSIDTIQCISHDARDRICRILNWPAERTRVVWHALPDSDEVLNAARNREESGLLKKPYYFLPVGAATGFNRVRKNVPKAVTAFRKLADANLNLMTAGTAPLTETVLSELLPASETGAVNNGIWRSQDGRIVILPSLERVEFLAAMHQSVAVVYPSRYEGFGLPTIEAMAMEVPLIACRATSIPEIVADAGLLVDPDDVDGMTEAMRRVTTDDALRRTLIANGRQRLPLFTRERLGREMMELFLASASSKESPSIRTA